MGRLGMGVKGVSRQSCCSFVMVIATRVMGCPIVGGSPI